MLKKEANAITGGLSKPSKMPCSAYNLPAFSCKTGSKLCKEKNSVCSKCYARKGRYHFPNVKNALYRRFESINNPKWVEAMTLLVKDEPGYFRWHDSGDLISVQHLEKICEVVRNTSHIRHWLPTKEVQIVMDYLKENKFPENLCVRISSYYIDKIPTQTDLLQERRFNWSGVISDISNKKMFEESLLKQTGEFFKTSVCQGVYTGTCGSCRKCWNFEEKMILYPEH